MWDMFCLRCYLFYAFSTHHVANREPWFSAQTVFDPEFDMVHKQEIYLALLTHILNAIKKNT